MYLHQSTQGLMTIFQMLYSEWLDPDGCAWS